METLKEKYDRNLDTQPWVKVWLEECSVHVISVLIALNRNSDAIQTI